MLLAGALYNSSVRKDARHEKVMELTPQSALSYSGVAYTNKIRTSALTIARIRGLSLGNAHLPAKLPERWEPSGGMVRAAVLFLCSRFIGRSSWLKTLHYCLSCIS